MGGDGSVTLPQLRAVHKRYTGLVVLHIDAHTDTYPGSGRDRYNTAHHVHARRRGRAWSTPRDSIHIGARGPTYMPGDFEYTRSRATTLIPGIDLFRRGIPDVLAYVHDKLRGRPVYLCFDMDFFDPPARRASVRRRGAGRRAGRPCSCSRDSRASTSCACDVNTVSPPHDVGGMTAFLAATVMLECLYLICRRPAH